MNKKQSIEIVQNTLESAFDKTRFVGFIKNLLNELEDAPFVHQGNYIPVAYQQYVSILERIGKYSDGKNRIDILVVYLKKETSIERARTMQRNFVAGYLMGKYGSSSEKDAALVAFVTPDKQDWRFSLVKMEYRFEDMDGKVKVKEEHTPAKRWSFLVGCNEKSHTAQSRLEPIMSDDVNNPSLEDLEEAFNIEKVTKEFFEKYRDLFMRTKEALDKEVGRNLKTKADFESKGIDTVNLAKKLLGQIIFLYYLQKKGWFGVPRDGEWGQGSKTFLRDLFMKKKDNENFFNDILEHLFYDALRNDRSHDDHYYGRFNCKIPFLNGGLFDPMNNYDWVHTDILLPDSLFSNKNITREGDEGDGILDVFDRYNFTVKEDEPFEKEVAIDPELLGKAYEKFNAIRPDNYDEFLKATKSGKKGDESKFNKQFGVYYTPREIVHYMCQQSLINYLETELEEKVNKDDLTTLILQGDILLEHEARAETNPTKKYQPVLSEEIRKHAALIDERLAAIKVCDPAVGSGAFPVGMMSEIVRTREVLKTWTKSEKTIYDFKRECIENSLYGVDIDAGAVEIAKLRLWLSLIVDENDIQNIKPLPNLDYKIVCGNSLLGVEKNLFNISLFTKLETLKPEYFNETKPARKQERKNCIDELINQITNGRSDFDFEIYFSEVFHEKDGFDVVIGNPPYGTVYARSSKSVYEKKYETFKRNNDIYVAFYQRGIELLKFNGELIYISPNTFLNGDYFKVLREYITKNAIIKEIRDYKEVSVFDDPTVFVCILNLSKQKNIVYPYQAILNIARQSIKNFAFSYYTVDKKSDIEFKPRDVVLNKINQTPTFVIDEKFFVKDVGFNYWTAGKGKKRDGDSIGDRVLYSGVKIHPKDIAFIKGRDIEKWRVNQPSHYLKHNFKQFLDSEIDTFRYSADFLEKKPKIVYRQTSNTIIAAIDNDGFYLDKTVHIIVPKNNWVFQPEALVAILNSTLFAYLYSYISQETAGRVFAQVKTTYIKKLPIPIKGDFRLIANAASFIITEKKNNHMADTRALEVDIDRMVYELYGLTEEEIKIIEGKE